MPIVITDSFKKTVTTAYAGRVVEVKKFQAQRNCSDTLDYSDYQWVACTTAICYKGRHGAPNQWTTEERDLELHERFEAVDCTNLFVWRGCNHMDPSVDEITDSQILEDFVAYKAYEAEQEAKRVADEQAREAARLRDIEERARNRPVRGKKMVVTRGRKVKPGTVGIVAYIHESGRVLLKDEKTWQDRNAQGVWVSADYLKACDD